MILSVIKHKKTVFAAGHLAAVFASLLTLTPVYLVCVNALKSESESAAMAPSLPSQLHFENFATVIERGKLVTSFFNSVLYAGSSAALATFFAALAAFVLSRRRSRMNRAIYFFLIMGIALPINFFTLTKIMQVAHLINTKPGIIILYATLQIPFAIFLIYGFIESIPRDLDDAATIDGCGPVKMFFFVVAPLLTPVLVTTFILSFLNTWNDFIMPLYYLDSSENWPMTLAVYNFFGQYKQSWNLVSADHPADDCAGADCLISVGQRFILSGMTSGAVKG